MNPNKLKSVMVLHGDTQEVLADAIGMSRVTLARKIHGTDGAQFLQKEIQAIKERYNLTAEDVDDIFFDFGVS